MPPSIHMSMNILPRTTKLAVILFLAIIFCDAYYKHPTVGLDTALVPLLTRALTILHRDIRATKTTLPHARYYHDMKRIHSNTRLLYQPVILLLHIADWVDSYSDPSSIIDGALAILGQSSSHRWTTLLFTSSFSCNHLITYQP
jgi:hypothetical protein